MIDDSALVVRWIERALCGAGHEVLGLQCGRKVLETLEHTSVDLLITDIYMPGLDGLEIIQRVRTLSPGTRVIAISARAPERNMFAVARFLGATETLQKPFHQEQLLQAVQRALSA